VASLTPEKLMWLVCWY